MNEKIKRLNNEKNMIQEELTDIKEEYMELKKSSKKFKKRMLTIFSISIILLLPMALYIVPIIPYKTTMAGFTMKGLVPILPKTIPFDYLFYPALIGSISLPLSSLLLTTKNICYYMPIKKLLKHNAKKLFKKRDIINKELAREMEKVYIKRTTNNNENQYKYRRNRPHFRNNYEDTKTSKEHFNKTKKIKTRKKQTT